MVSGTYLDGPGKSGAEYAQLYADENGIYHPALLEMTDFARQLEDYEKGQSARVSAIVVVDDILGSGKGIVRGVQSFVDINKEMLVRRDIPLVVVIISAHRGGVERFHQATATLTYQNIDLRVCETITMGHAAFEAVPGIWSDRREYDEARNLVTLLGRRVAPKNPLGFANQGLLIVFPKTCPNNSLPILHSDSSGSEPWHHLFRRL